MKKSIGSALIFVAKWLAFFTINLFIIGSCQFMTPTRPPESGMFDHIFHPSGSATPNSAVSTTDTTSQSHQVAGVAPGAPPPASPHNAIAAHGDFYIFCLLLALLTGGLVWTGRKLQQTEESGWHRKSNASGQS